jgi:hypothetical protein
MKALAIFISFFAAVSLACTMAAYPQKNAGELNQPSRPAVSTPPQLEPTLQAEPILANLKSQPEQPRITPAAYISCSVSTGQPGGALTVRSCPGATCSALDWLSEGEIITTTYPITAWTQTNAGWMNTKYLECTHEK